MTESEALSKIEWAAKSMPSPSVGWLESISIQLQYCADLLQGKVSSERVEEINMGYMAVREFDGYEKGVKEYELTEAICEIDSYIKNRFFSYAQKVRHGLHKRQ